MPLVAIVEPVTHSPSASYASLLMQNSSAAGRTLMSHSQYTIFKVFNKRYYRRLTHEALVESRAVVVAVLQPDDDDFPAFIYSTHS
jgi:hypothetical protein